MDMNRRKTSANLQAVIGEKKTLLQPNYIENEEGFNEPVNHSLNEPAIRLLACRAAAGLKSFVQPASITTNCRSSSLNYWEDSLL